MGQAHDAHELAEQIKHTDKNQIRAAILVSVLAMALAIVSLGGNNAAKEATQENILAANAYNFYQAKNVRQTAYKLAADQIEADLLSDKLTPKARDYLQKKLEDYRKNITRYESEPETKEGKKELLVIAKAHEKHRDIALRMDPWFDYAESLLQIAIVLTSVGIVMGSLAFIWASLGLGSIGLILGLNGFFLLF